MASRAGTSHNPLDKGMHIPPIYAVLSLMGSSFTIVVFSAGSGIAGRSGHSSISSRDLVSLDIIRDGLCTIYWRMLPENRASQGLSLIGTRNAGNI